MNGGFASVKYNRRLSSELANNLRITLCHPSCKVQDILNDVIYTASTIKLPAVCIFFDCMIYRSLLTALLSLSIELSNLQAVFTGRYTNIITKLLFHVKSWSERL